MSRHTGRAPWSLWVIVVALALAAALATGPAVVWASGGGGWASGGGRGENPVVGSLPCVVRAFLNSMFWVPLGYGGPTGGDPGSTPATLGFIGPPDLGGSVLDANGTPYGMVNFATGWTCVGLTNEGYLLLLRPPVASGQVVVWEWVPVGYVGGTVTVEDALGTSSYPIAAQAFPLPVQGVAVGAGTPWATVTIAPPAQNSALGNRVVRVSTTAATIQVRYQL